MTDFQVWLKQFERALQDCQRLYLSSARLCVEQFPGFLPGTPEEFLQLMDELMDDLHKGLLIKIYVEIVQADGRWSREEKNWGRCCSIISGRVKSHVSVCVTQRIMSFAKRRN